MSTQSVGMPLFAILSYLAMVCLEREAQEGPDLFEYVGASLQSYAVSWGVP